MALIGNLYCSTQSTIKDKNSTRKAVLVIPRCKLEEYNTIRKLYCAGFRVDSVYKDMYSATVNVVGTHPNFPVDNGAKRRYHVEFIEIDKPEYREFVVFSNIDDGTHFRIQVGGKIPETLPNIRKVRI